MQAFERAGVVALDPRDAQQLHGGNLLAGAVALAIAYGSAIGAGFKWGYENLGPIFNEYF